MTDKVRYPLDASTAALVEGETAEDRVQSAMKFMVSEGFEVVDYPIDLDVSHRLEVVAEYKGVEPLQLLHDLIYKAYHEMELEQEKGVYWGDEESVVIDEEPEASEEPAPLKPVVLKKGIKHVDDGSEEFEVVIMVGGQRIGKTKAHMVGQAVEFVSPVVKDVTEGFNPLGASAVIPKETSKHHTE